MRYVNLLHQAQEALEKTDAQGKLLPEMVRYMQPSAEAMRC